MKVVIAPDSFKECLAASDVAAAIAKGWQDIFPDDEVICHPMADGGEGSINAILHVIKGEFCIDQVNDPLGRPIKAHWAWFPNNKAAIIEMAEANGLQCLTSDERNPMLASSYGTGQLILKALEKGAKVIILTIGGSATNDAGVGMMSALGVKFLDSRGQPINTGGAALSQVATIDDSLVHPKISQTKFLVASDVNNPLCGKKGASVIFGAQKGATEQQIAILDSALGHFATICQNKYFRDERSFAGAGAAGGLGFAAKLFLNAEFKPGVELIAQITQLEKNMQNADLVITGEGQIDKQSVMGKTPIGVAKLAKKQNIPVIAIAGTLGKEYEVVYQAGIDAAFSLIASPMSLEEAKFEANNLLMKRASDIARLWHTARQ